MTNIKPTLLVMAAGIGSRYGGVKQMDTFGPSGETIVEYSIYDAIRAGFGKVVFVIRKSFDDDFRELIGKKIEKKIEVEYVYQEIDAIPAGLPIHPERNKPWGTGHAVLVAAREINEPFVVINGDDFYGTDAFKVAADFFKTNQGNVLSMVGYILKNTLSEHGYVSRGVCSADTDNYFVDVVECTKIQKLENKVVYFNEKEQQQELDENSIVSMNFWCLYPKIFEYLQKDFEKFIRLNSMQVKAEYFLPYFLAKLVKDKKFKIKVLTSTSKWFGVTYKEDRPIVMNSLQQLIKNGQYPDNLWK